MNYPLCTSSSSRSFFFFFFLSLLSTTQHYNILLAAERTRAMDRTTPSGQDRTTKTKRKRSNIFKSFTDIYCDSASTKDNKHRHLRVAWRACFSHALGPKTNSLSSPYGESGHRWSRIKVIPPLKIGKIRRVDILSLGSIVLKHHQKLGDHDQAKCLGPDVLHKEKTKDHLEANEYVRLVDEITGKISETGKSSCIRTHRKIS